MHRKSLNKWLLIFLICSMAAGRLCAQRLVSDMKIVYKLELPPEQLQADAMLEGSTLTQYMRGHLSRIDMNLNVVHYTYLINSKEQTLITLIDNHGDKYLIRSDKEEYDKELKQYTGIRFKDEAGTKELLGYTCKKATGIMPDGKTFEVYYTPDLIPENKHYNRRFVNLKGMPLQFEIITRTGAKMNVIATNIDLHPVPAALFETPVSGYKVISKEELQKMGS
ncbi:GLPGLI family protein [Chitinophaga rupis]|uniref:GLPGLI family protein n=1 Tax=Chitinophaga rupis TaxID=573321 RepID=A0A1H8D729_9BACT|nr:hypothetical protein [Chitinophaga rupis]SEN02935.1 GLPGLI family protein [Chitinophaga rupis]